MKTKFIGVLLAIAMVGILLTGMASAMQSSVSVAVVDGTVRSQSMQTSATYGDLPFDEEKYNLDLYALHSSQLLMTHSMDTDMGIEVQTSLSYMPVSNLKMVFLEEGISKSRVGKGENESLCYDSSARSRITAQMLGYESASIVDTSNVAFATNAVGLGAFRVQAQEKIVTGDVNGTFTESVSMERVAIRGGMFNVSSMMTGEIPDYPALAPDRGATLCPFFKP